MNTVVLVHGFTDTPGRMAYMARYLRKRGWKVLTPKMSPSNGSAALQDLAAILSAFINEHVAADERIDLVGFSMGGLVCRYYLQCLGGDARTDRFVSISTPHIGTMTAHLLSGAGIRQMRPGSTFLRALNSDLTKLEKLDCTVIFTPLDLIIIPARSSVLPFARVFRLFIPLHPLMIYHPRVFLKLAVVLSAPLKRLLAVENVTQR